MWEEVATAEKENRRELVLSGKQILTRVQANGLDQNIYKLVNLNYLDISEAGLGVLSPDLGNLTNLTNLVLKGNTLTCLPDSLGKLVKLKLLDVSKNLLTDIPDISGLEQLTTLNLSLNKLTRFPDIGLDKCLKMSSMDLSVNDLKDIEMLESAHLELLAELNLSRNEIPALSPKIQTNWPAIKKLDLAHNKLNALPALLGDCLKLKELNILNNPLADNRLKKMAAQKSTKSVLDYIRQNGEKEGEDGGGGGGGKKKGKKGKGGDKEPEPLPDICDRLNVLSLADDNSTEVYFQPAVKEVRPFIVVCFLKNLDLQGDNLRKFLQLQTKLHKGVCANRTLATIATHELSAVKGPLKYTALEPRSFEVEPLTGGPPVNAAKLVGQLKKEAEAMRKEKKRNAISGIHQYLPMLDRHPLYPCLLDREERVISFPPVTNSGLTRISGETKEILVEVTSNTKLADAKMVADTLLREILEAGLVATPEDELNGKCLTVLQGRVLDHEGALKVTYPSKADLVFTASKPGFAVVRS